MRILKTKLFPFLILIICTGLIARGQSMAPKSDQEYNPEYHFYPSIDPTGLFYNEGSYYLNWGAASSNDLVHWKMTPFGLERARFFRRISSNDPADQRKMMKAMEEQRRSQVLSGGSGSIVVDRNNSSGLGINGKPPLLAFQHNNVQSGVEIKIVYSNDNAKTWKLFEKPALSALPGVYRDPKVFWYEPDEKWIMVIGWANIQKIKFFSSTNLKDWEYMSEFGPWGAVAGEWECVDFFPLPVDGATDHMKWVMTVSLQPCNGEYFVGEFDGTRFVLDQDFINDLTYDSYMPSGEMLFDFERGIDEWEMEGDAFIECPVDNEGVLGREGSRYISSAHNGVISKGKIISPEFTISKDHIVFLAGGGHYPGEESINLVIDGVITRQETGNSNSTNMNWTGWDVSEFRGKKARIEIVDNISEGAGPGARGFIYCDAFMLSDDLPSYKYNKGWEKAFWVDWGPDFYAVRSWNSYAPEDRRTIWVGWMGIWRYFFTEPQKGLLSVPRSLELKSFPEGIRLIQNPVKELESLRVLHKTAGEKTVEGIWKPKEFRPERNSYELVVEFENESAEEFGLNLCVGEKQKTVIGYDASSEELYVDRRKSGYDEFSAVFPAVYKGPMKNRTDTIRLHIFIDKCSVEVFGNDGETTLSCKIYPDPSSLGIEVFSNHGKVRVRSLELWDLGSIELF
jgi:sucrose-6-phosphate hydrolase SacC (GH32 family)